MIDDAKKEKKKKVGQLPRFVFSTQKSFVFFTHPTSPKNF
jgi:hypothetical protein